MGHRHQGHQPVRRRRAVVAQSGDEQIDEPSEASLADIVERMFTLFEHELSLATIVRVVRRCRRELDILAHPASAASLELMARQRLGGMSAIRSAAAQTLPHG